MNKCISLILLLCLALFSCNRGEEASFNGTLSVVDKYIENKEPGMAKRRLRPLIRRAKTESEFLSLYKRCKNLGDRKSSRKILKRAIKELPFSQKIRACYCFFLLQDGNSIDEELLLPLYGSDYDGLLVENRFRAIAAADETEAFFQPEMYSFHIIASKVTGNEDYLQNAATILAMKGQPDDAIDLAPQIPKNPTFWAMLAYDARNFRTSLDYALQANGKDAAIITADSFLQQKDFGNAVNIWTDLCREEPGLSPLPYLNLINYAKEIGDFPMGKSVLDEAMVYFKQDVNVLSAFARYAIDSNAPENDDMFTGELRMKGLRSRKMIDFDNRPRVSPELPLELFVNAFSETGNPELQTEIFKYQCSLQGISPAEIKRSDIYRYLETEQKSDELIHYFTWVFLVQKEYESARDLLLPVIVEKLGHRDFSVEELSLLSDWQKEIYAHLVAIQVPNEQYPDYAIPLRLLENISYTVDSSAAFNHAILLETAYKYNDALDLLQQIYEASDDEKKSLCKYNRGRIFLELGDKEQAYGELKEATSLDPSNLNARLLFRDLNYQ